MSILNKHLPFVNEQLAFHERMVEKVGGASFRGNLHKGTAEKFKALAAYLVESDKVLDAPQHAMDYRSESIPPRVSHVHRK